MQIFDEIKVRGVEDVAFISMDGVSGLEEQRCIVHLIRNSINYIPSKDYKEYTAQLKKIYGAINLKATIAEFDRFKEAWKHYPGAMGVWERNWMHMEQFFHYGSAVRRVILPTLLRALIPAFGKSPEKVPSLMKTRFARSSICVLWSYIKNGRDIPLCGGLCTEPVCRR